MNRRHPTNIGASIRQRLLNHAHKTGEDFQFVLNRYILERFLYRLGQSEYQDRFVLKGAILFLLWGGEMHRVTRDLDLLGYGSSAISDLEEIIRLICNTPVEAEDGIVFLTNTIQAKRIREDQEYEGIRITVDTRLENAKVRLQIDVGFGDTVIPGSSLASFPTLLDHPVPTVWVYPKETVVAEKFQAMVALDMANSRMKDFYDLWFLTQYFEFQGDILKQALIATFQRRSTPMPDQIPLALTPEFATDTRKQTQWKAFLRKGRLQSATPSLDEVVVTLHEFLMPVVRAISDDQDFNSMWKGSGSWQTQ